MNAGMTVPVPAHPATPLATEWPTVALAATIYAMWFGLTWFHAALPLWLLVPLGAWTVAWHSSLQHEILHGHPTPSRALNDALAFPPLALWIPFERYRDTHLTHHRDERLTDPIDDPESRYVTREGWARLGVLGRTLVRAQATMLGRLAIGPFWVIATFVRSEIAAIVAGDRRLARIWLVHALAVAALLAWLELACRMSAVVYILGFALPGTSLMLIRSFAEHRAEREVVRRTAIVERAGLFGVLFLHNNLHAAHHGKPGLAWFRLPRHFRESRNAILAANGGLVYRGYADMAWRYFVRPHDAVVHRFDRAPAA
jgi:fatty acid desaturase